MKFYTNVGVRGNHILYRGVNGNARETFKVPYTPRLFVNTPDESSHYKSLYGQSLREVTFPNIQEAKSYIEQYSDVSNVKVYGSRSWNYTYISEQFPGTLDFDYTKIRIVSIDIETTATHGFPDAEKAIEEVLLITMKDFHTKRVVTLGVKPSKAKNYVQCKNEEDLLRSFIREFRIMDPDILTGWNVKEFDVAYLGSRIKSLLGDDTLNTLSPWNSVRRVEMKTAMGSAFTYAISGVAVLDFLDLYKKFTFTRRESYKLDHIAEVEISRKKLEMPCSTFVEFYTNHWETFVEYNQVDTDLVDELEAKLGLIYLAVTLAYISKVNFEDVFSPVKTWGVYIESVLAERNVFLETTKSHRSASAQIEGAYVMEPKPGFYSWVLSFDATSLYPSIIMALNMSPETIRHTYPCSVADLLTNSVDEDVLEMIKSNNLTMAANGSTYTRDHLGIMPELTEKMFEGRKTAKKKMLEAKQQYINTGNEEFKREADRQGVIQQALKVQLNSLYGASANEWFVFYDTRIAEGITMTGQYIIQKVRDVVNEELSKIAGNYPYAFYCDTDSVYLTVDPIVQKFWKDAPTEKLVEAVDKLAKSKIHSFFKRGTDEIHSTLNCHSERIEFKREAIADRGIWLAKKKYALRVWDNEGVRYETPDLKVMGIQIVQSSTPAYVRTFLKDCLPYVLDNDLKGLTKKMEIGEAEFRKLPVAEIAFPRTANNLREYSDKNSIYRKGCPIHVRGSLVYNHYLKELDLTKKYVSVKEGDKIKYVHLKMPNMVRENIIAFVDKLPTEFKIDSMVDYATQWEKSCIAPITSILDAVGWKLKEQSSLEDFFG